MKDNRSSADEPDDRQAALDWYRKITGGPVSPAAPDELEIWTIQEPERTPMIVRLFQMNAVITEIHEERDRLQALYQQGIENGDHLVAKARALQPSGAKVLEHIFLISRLEDNLREITTAIEACLSVAAELNACLFAVEPARQKLTPDRALSQGYDA